MPFMAQDDLDLSEYRRADFKDVLPVSSVGRLEVPRPARRNERPHTSVQGTKWTEPVPVTW